MITAQFVACSFTVNLLPVLLWPATTGQFIATSVISVMRLFHPVSDNRLTISQSVCYCVVLPYVESCSEINNTLIRHTAVFMILQET